MQTITSDELLAADADRYQEIRRTATRARNENRDVYVCENCGFAVYAPRAPNTRLPYWRHRKGAPKDCPWWTGDPGTLDEISARQFQGAQESPLHQKIKYAIADQLNADPQTEAGTVIVDQNVIGENGRRRPDVRATYGGRKIAIEVQLATTQIPIIDARESFYEREQRFLIWVTWNFIPVERSRMRTAFEDIFYSHNKNLFSLDEEALELSKADGSTRLRVFWEMDGKWQSKLIALSELNWPEKGLPYAVAPAPEWHIDFRERWLKATSGIGTPQPDRGVLLNEIAEKVGMEGIDRKILEEADFDHLLNCILSFVSNHPIGSGQQNLVEVINTFLMVPRRHGFARLMRKVLVSTGHSELLLRPSVQKKFEIADQEIQDDHKTITGRVALKLFPELFSRAKGSIQEKS